ncbi:MAG: hypothetical protein IJG33_04460 [Selenomonadaceae bacterium]|nr:hypothetical protein [Selenomonadaceae bacterium]
MTEQEQINSEVQMKLALQDAKFNAFVQEMRDFKDEMRQQNQMRAEEIRDLRNEIRTGLDGMGKHVRNLAITSMAAIGAMVVTVIISLLRS